MDDLSFLDPTPLELLADDAGIGPQELRELLRQAIEEQAQRAGQPVEAPPGPLTR